MVISQPRSGSTWTSNWLTTDTTLCIHDPLWTVHYEDWDTNLGRVKNELGDWDNIQSSKTLGISCTGIALWPDWVNNHPARKVILHRDHSEIEHSLRTSLGLEEEYNPSGDNLDKIRGMHVPWTNIFTDPKPIYEYLLNRPFDQERHRELVKMHIQPHIDSLQIDYQLTQRLILEYADTSL